MTKKIIRWQTICKEASEQSKRTKIPQVTKYTNSENQWEEVNLGEIEWLIKEKCGGKVEYKKNNEINIK